MAKLCYYNLDPQHGCGFPGIKEDKPAIIKVMEKDCIKLPLSNDLIGFSRPDPDSIGAAALIVDMFSGEDKNYKLCSILNVHTIANIDSFFNSGVYHPTELPTKENPWPNGKNEKYSAIAAMCFDINKSIEDKIEEMRKYIKDDIVDESYITSVQNERKKLIENLNNGSIRYDVVDDICVVYSKDRAATSVAYSKAPIAIESLK